MGRLDHVNGEIVTQEMTIWIPGTPKPQPSKNAGKTKAGQVFTYSPKTADEWKRRVHTYATAHMSKCEWRTVPKPLPVQSEVWFVFKRPQNHLRSNGERKEWAPTYHTAGTDRDNLEKALNDPLMWAGVVEDDGQICLGGLHKVYHRRMEGAMVILRAGRCIEWPIIPDAIRDRPEVHEIERQPVLQF